MKPCVIRLQRAALLLSLPLACACDPEVASEVPSAAAPDNVQLRHDTPTQAEVLDDVFVDAALGWDVPAALLRAIALTESGLQEDKEAHTKCEGEKTVGIMGLRLEADTGATLDAASRVAGLDEALVREDLAANIDAAAAWLRDHSPDAEQARLEDWWDAVAAYPGDTGVAGQLYAAEIFTKVIGGESLDLEDDSTFEIAHDVEDAGSPALDEQIDQAITMAAASPDYPSASYVPACSSNYSTSNRTAAHIDMVVIHTVQGSYSSAYNWFANCSANVSAHYTVSKYGEITQSVRDKDRAWHAGWSSTNSRSIGIEHEGFVDNPATWTEAMYQASAALTRHLCDKYGIPKDRQHIIGHHEVPGCGSPGGGGVGCHHDPGPHFDWNYYMALVTGGSSGSSGGGPQVCEPEAVSGAESQPFKDMPPGAFGKAEAEALFDAGITAGCSASPPLFCPECDLNRAAMIALLVNAAGYDLVSPATPSFSDVPKDAWYYAFVETAYANGVTAGCAPGKFCPDSLLTRAQAAAMVVNAAGLPLVDTCKGYFNDTDGGDWFCPYAEALKNACVITHCGKWNFCPDTTMNRAEAAVFIARAFDVGDVNECIGAPAPDPDPEPEPEPDTSPSVGIESPGDGQVVENPVTFAISAANVSTVRLFADQWALGDAWNPTSKTSHTYEFSGTGFARTIRLIGYDGAGNEIASDEIVITVESQGINAWGYIMDVDYGVRDDYAGGGHFGASRYNNPGGHSGIDFLAPVGADLFAPCSGGVLSGYANGYGYYVQLVCALPHELTDGQGLYASLFFAHLSQISAANGSSVSAGQKIGEVGKSGNASGSSVNAHVHFEVAIHASSSAAYSESHASSNHSDNWAAGQFEAHIESKCWGPQGFNPKTGPKMKGRRSDPFMLLSCLTTDKPDLWTPPASLQSSLKPWSLHYDAAFNVNQGL